MKDNFSSQASIYAKYRPAYPSELFDFILSHTEHKDTAWDCATGNGQTAKELAKQFTQVFATDISAKQLEYAGQRDNIVYSVQPAEQTNFPGNTFDLITVSQALHWFDFDKFYAEVNRVGKPGSLLAAWVYTLLHISPEIDELVRVELYQKTLGASYWDKERKFVDDDYITIPFPFMRIETPVFYMTYEWTLPELTGYLSTWSAIQKFIRQHQYNPVDKILPALKKSWKSETMAVRFPVHILLGKIGK